MNLRFETRTRTRSRMRTRKAVLYFVQTAPWVKNMHELQVGLKLDGWISDLVET